MIEEEGGRKRQKVTLIVVLILVTAFLALLLNLHYNSVKDPYSSTVVQISRLVPLVKDVQQTPNSREPTKSTYNYIHDLKLIKKRCKQIQEYNQATTPLQLDSTKRSILNQSRDLCTDLIRLADYSLVIYSSAEPLLSARTTARRYETFRPLSTHIRQRHLDAIKNAFNELKKAPAGDIDFPSSSKNELEKLQAGIQDSKGLAYLPSLQQFQMNMLAERQRFWGPYANATQLTKSLQLQLDAYCQTLADSKSRPSECKQP